MTWRLYIQKRGPLNHGQRLEWLMGRLSWQVHHAAGGKKLGLDSFVRYHDVQPEEERFATPEDFMRVLAGSAAKGASDGK